MPRLTDDQAESAAESAAEAGEDYTAFRPESVASKVERMTQYLQDGVATGRAERLARFQAEVERIRREAQA